MVKIINCDLNVFKSQIKNKKLYCFGAGKIFREFVNNNDDIEIEAVIDNFNSSEYVECQNRNVKVISYTDFISVCDETCMVLITTKAYNDIVNQMDEEICLSDIPVYVLFLMEQNYSIYNEIEYSDLNPRIPKVIHYCWFGGNPMPEEYKKYIDSWKKYCPDYEIIRWDETNYDVNKNKYVKQAYENKKWAFVSDYARIDIIYNYGGIYLDTDVELIQSLDDLLGWVLFCGYETDNYVNFGLGFGAVPKNSIIKNIKDYYEKKSFVKEDGSFDLETCPVINTRFLLEMGFIRNGEFQCIDNVAIYPMEVFAPYNYVTNVYNITEHSHSIHHYSASWCSERQQNEKQKRFVDVDAILSRSVVFDTNIKDNSFQIYEYSPESKSAGSKAVKDIRNVLESVGYKVLVIVQNSSVSEQWDDIYNKITEEATVVIQHPFWNDCLERFETLRKLKEKKRVRFISIVHDVEKLRKTFNNDYMSREYDFMLNIASVIVVHNHTMMHFFQKETDKPIVSLEIFDYLFRGKCEKQNFDRTVIIAGNLDSLKSKYLNELADVKDVHFNLFGPNYSEKKEISNITYYGAIISDLVPLKLVGSFGLVWDGESIETCSGNMGEYLRYNNPHKLSLYLSAGIPVIIWSQAAEAKFVMDNNVGILVDSLKDISNILAQMSEQKYDKMLSNVKKISERLREGYYTKKALLEAEKILNH